MASGVSGPLHPFVVLSQSIPLSLVAYLGDTSSDLHPFLHLTHGGWRGSQDRQDGTEKEDKISLKATLPFSAVSPAWLPSQPPSWSPFGNGVLPVPF